MVEFSDYVKPNEALEDGEIDLNAFQTEIYFNNFVKERGYTDLGGSCLYSGCTDGHLLFQV